jgi:aldehyde dehydrogenase (NAD+)
VAQQEFFGPVQCLIGYENEEDAVRIANDSIYGLSGGVLSADLERGKRFARRIRTGTMMINGGMWYGPEVPFGGYKCSGLGRENGRAGFEEFLEVKALAEPAS